MHKITYLPSHGTRNILIALLVFLPRLARQACTIPGLTTRMAKPLNGYWQPLRAQHDPRYLVIVTRAMLAAHVQQTMAGGLDLQDMLDIVCDRQGLRQHVGEVLARAS